jgi:hypothetical protein
MYLVGPLTEESALQEQSRRVTTLAKGKKGNTIPVTIPCRCVAAGRCDPGGCARALPNRN